jgi:hypothetical protein
VCMHKKLGTSLLNFVPDVGQITMSVWYIKTQH